jgi:hypothetical protein
MSLHIHLRPGVPRDWRWCAADIFNRSAGLQHDGEIWRFPIIGATYREHDETLVEEPA